MITIGDLDKLITQWKLKLAQRSQDYYDIAYKDGINDCLYDLNNLIEDLLEQEERAYAYMNEIGGN
jgi:hypothetical protein